MWWLKKMQHTQVKIQYYKQLPKISFKICEELYRQQSEIGSILDLQDKSQKIQQLFLEVQQRQEVRILLKHPKHRPRFLRLEAVLRVMHKVASGAEFAVFMLMIVSTHLLSQDGLVKHQLLDSMSEEAVISVAAEASVSETFTKLQLPLDRSVRRSFIACQFHTHDQREFIDYIKSNSSSNISNHQQNDNRLMPKHGNALNLCLYRKLKDQLRRILG